jgi:hypothetical protein
LNTNGEGVTKAERSRRPKKKSPKKQKKPEYICFIALIRNEHETVLGWEFKGDDLKILEEGIEEPFKALKEAIKEERKSDAQKLREFELTMKHAEDLIQEINKGRSDGGEQLILG